MKHFKNEVESVMEGKECGVQIDKFAVGIKSEVMITRVGFPAWRCDRDV